MTSAEKIASPDFQAWLRHQIAQHCEIFISMNALREGARGRTKADVAMIRHVYLDFDENGTQAVESLLKREDLPKPNYLVNSSPDKWQVVWKVAGFGKEGAEALQRGLVHETGADPAATDCARVLRLPGFYNHKYSPPHFVRMEPSPVIHTGPSSSRPSSPTELRAGFPNERSWKNTAVGRSIVPVGTRLGLRQTRAEPRRIARYGHRRDRQLPPL